MSAIQEYEFIGPRESAQLYLERECSASAGRIDAVLEDAYRNPGLGVPLHSRSKGGKGALILFEPPRFKIRLNP
jgi:hypothetical protein